MNRTLKFFSYFFVGFLAVALTLGSCTKEEPPVDPDPVVSFDALIALIAEADGLLNGATEGFSLGQYQFGAIAQLTDVRNSAQGVVDSNTDDMSLVDNAVQQLQAAIDAFKANQVTSVATPWVQQIPGNRIELTDSDNGIDRGLLGLIEQGKDFTIELQIKPVNLQNLGFANSLISAAKQFGNDEGVSDDAGFHIRYFSDGSFEFINGTGNTSSDGWMNSPRSTVTLVEGEWNHIAYVHSGEDRIMYLNGEEALRTQLPYTSIGYIDAVSGISIGNAFDWSDRVVNALYEDIRIWNKALSAEELNNQNLTSTGDGLEAWFPLKSDAGSEVIDVSGNYKAVLGDFTPWAPDGDISQVPVDYGDLMAAIMIGKDFIAGVTEGTEVGDYGVGTSAFVQASIDAGMAVIDDKGSQPDASIAADRILNAVSAVEDNTIDEAGPASGLVHNVDDPSTVGFRLTRVDGTNPALPEGSYTIELEVNMNDLSQPFGPETSLLGSGALQFRTIVSVDGQDPNANEGAIEFYVEGAGWTCACSPAGTMTAGEWVKLAAVYDESSNTSTIFMNGVEVASGAEGAYTRRDNNGWTDMWLGNRAGAGNIVDGSTRNLRIWSVARSASEVNGDINGDEDGLEMYFPLNQKNASFYQDVTGNFYGQRIGVSYLD